METEGKKLYASVEQKNLLIEFIKKHPKLVSAKFSPDYSQKDAQTLWQEIAEILNSCVGAKKDWKSWRKTWQDITCRTKTKSADNKRLSLATGGGPFVINPITSFEDKVLETITPVAIEGHTNVKESITDFTFDDVVDVPPIPSCSTETSRLQTSIDKQKKVFPRAPRKKLVYASQAARDYKQSLDIKNNIKSSYYEKKLAILERIALAKEKIAGAKERAAVAQEKIAASKEKSANSKADIAKNIGAIAHVLESFQDLIS